jgi:hypothetical protein
MEIKSYKLNILTILLILLSGCEKEDPKPSTSLPKGEVSMSFDLVEIFSNGRVLRDSLANVDELVLSIQNADDTPTEYASSRIGIVANGQSLQSEAIELPIGEYKITEFYLVDSDDNTLFAIPVSGSKVADKISTPLPLSFNVSESNSTIVETEVLPTRGLDPSDFGLSEEIANWPTSFSFLLSVLDGDNMSDLLPGEVTVISLDSSFIVNQSLSAIVGNVITLDSQYEEYTVGISSNGYESYQSIFKRDSLLQHQVTPLLVELIPDSDNGNTYQGDLRLRSQEEVDSIGQYNYTEITGSLSLGISTSGSPITNLGPLSTIEAIGGNLDIDYVGIASIEGLHNVKSIGGELQVESMPNLVSFEGLRSLTSVKQLWIRDNSKLLNFKGLEGVTEFTGGTNIIDNPSLQSLEGLDGLTQVTSLEIIRCEALSSVKGLGALTRADFIWLYWLPSLTSLSGFDNSMEELGFLSIMEVPNLADMSGLMSVSGVITQSLGIENTNISSLNGLRFASNIDGGIGIIDNSSLMDISALSTLSIIGASLSISGNDSLESLDGLENLSSVGNRYGVDYGYRFDISNNDALQDLCGLTNVIQNGTYYEVNISRNLYNPTINDIQNGNCTLP